MEGAEIVLPLASGDSQRVSNPLSSSTRVSEENIQVERSVEGDLKSERSNLSERNVVSPTEHVANTAQKERISKLVQQIIPKIWTLANGISMILDAKGFKLAKDIINLLSNITQYIQYVLLLRDPSEQLSKLKQLFKACFYNGERKEIIFKRLILIMSSTCKIILRLAPQLPCLQVLSKSLPQVSSLLDVMSLVFNYEKFTEGGFTKKNVLKIVAALSYHIISSATFVIASSMGVIPACVLMIALVKFFNWLAAGGMKDVALIVQPLDKLLLSNKLTDNVCSFIRSICPNEKITDEDISQQESNYSLVIGLRLCISTASEIIETIGEFIKNSRETPEMNVAEETPQDQEAPGDINENLLPGDLESMATDEQMTR
jgi:hypothetical protein